MTFRKLFQRRREPQSLETPDIPVAQVPVLDELHPQIAKEIVWMKIRDLPPMPASIVTRIQTDAVYQEWLGQLGGHTASGWEISPAAGATLLEVVKGSGFRQMPHFALMELAVLQLNESSGSNEVAVASSISQYDKRSFDVLRADQDLQNWVVDTMASSRAQIGQKLTSLGLNDVPLFRRTPVRRNGEPVRFVLESWTTDRKFADGWSSRSHTGQSALLEARVSPDAAWCVAGRGESEIVVSPTLPGSVELVAVRA